jgi:hypothetical protein
MRTLARRAGNRVELVPLRLPDACAALWLGFTGLDRIGYNQDWPQHEIGPGRARDRAPAARALR